MKKMFALAIVAASLTACNDSSTDKVSVDADTTSTSTMTTTTTTQYTPSDGDVSYRNGKVVVWKNNDWVDADEDVTLNNGVIVRKNGEVKKDNDVVVLKDGEVVDKSGNFFDKAGNAIDDAWDATKKGAKKAGEAVEGAAKKVGEETKDVFDGDDKKKDDKK